MLAAIIHNLLRAVGTLAGKALAVARGAPLRRPLVNGPARFTRPQGRRTLRLPAHWTHSKPWKALWNNVFTKESAVQVAV